MPASRKFGRNIPVPLGLMIKSSGYEDQAFVADFYDAVYAKYTDSSHDVDFFVNYAKKAGGKTLELGCGTGRVLIPTAQAGCEVTGLDLSPYMLVKCLEKLVSQTKDVKSRIKLIRGDMTNFTTGEQYTLVTIPFRAFQHLIQVSDQKACLNCVHRHLAPGGLFILDVFKPSLPRLTDTRYLMEMEVDPPMTLPDGRVVKRINRTASFHIVEQYNDIEMIYYVKYPDGREERLVHSFPMRYFFRYEMDHLLSLCGFKIVEFFGHFDKSNFIDNSTEMIFVAEKIG
jgi:ubiquinone/menaquinone biosynthesis C-methylase UbiE